MVTIMTGFGDGRALDLLIYRPNGGTTVLLCKGTMVGAMPTALRGHASVQALRMPTQSRGHGTRDQFPSHVRLLDPALETSPHAPLALPNTSRTFCSSVSALN